jgi:hypothetical protein
MRAVFLQMIVPTRDCRLQFAICNCLGLVLWFVATTAHAQTPDLPPTTVGMPARVEQLVLPGSELEPAPIDDATPVVIRIDAVYPHGTAFRYDLVYYGLEPGDYDLRTWLRRKDGTATDDLPALPVTIASLLPAGQVEPHGLQFARLPWLGGYRLLMVLAAVLWLAGLAWLLFPRRRLSAAVVEEVAPPPSLADRLRPLVTDAMAGRLAPARLAELERALVRYWRRRLGFEDLAPGEALARLRGHSEAGPLLTQLEAWLHRPAGRTSVDVNALLAPYQSVSPEELDRAPVLAERTSQA